MSLNMLKKNCHVKFQKLNTLTSFICLPLNYDMNYNQRLIHSLRHKNFIKHNLISKYMFTKVKQVICKKNNDVYKIDTCNLIVTFLLLEVNT